MTFKRHALLLLPHWKLVVPIAIFLFHTALFWTWIIDDAGITFAYAQNFADGHGLVAQPGSEPIEAYSNFLWMVLMVPFFWLGQFDPYFTPKLIAIVFVIGTYLLIYNAELRMKRSSLLASIALIFTALNSSFVIWVSSGLENSLYMFLISFLFWLHVLYFYQQQPRMSSITIGLGVIAAAIALTRPDGLVFGAIFPFLYILINRLSWKDILKSSTTRQIMIPYLTCYLVIYGSFLLFRLAYFGEAVPNTYHAKGGVGIIRLLQVLTLQTPLEFKVILLVRDATYPFNSLILIAVLILTTILLLRREFDQQLIVVGSFMFWTLSVYMLLPEDWMRENRFATAFFPFFYLYVLMVSVRFLYRLPSYYANLIAYFLILTMFILYGLYTYSKSIAYQEKPDLSLRYVKDTSETFESYMAQLDVENASILTPDLGGLLYYSDLRAYDLAGLADKTLATTLDKDQGAFYDYLFETAHPTLIYIHGNWSYVARLDDDPRFRRDYLAICEQPEGNTTFEVEEGIYRGIYVRREVINSDNQTAFVRLRDMTKECP